MSEAGQIIWPVGIAVNDDPTRLVVDATDYDALRDDNARLRRALAAIVKYGDKGIHGNDGICPFGCDCPHIAQAALDSGKGVQGET